MRSSTANPTDFQRVMTGDSGANGFQSLDWLGTLIAVLDTQGAVRFVNAALENALGQSRRNMVSTHFVTCFAEPALLDKALSGVRSNDFAALRFEAALLRLGQEPLPVHVTVSVAEQVGHVMVEMWPLEQQARQDREERIREQAKSRTPLGGFAVQLSCCRWICPPLSCANTPQSSCMRLTGCKPWLIDCWLLIVTLMKWAM